MQLVRVHGDVVDLHDVRMVHAGHRLGLALPHAQVGGFDSASDTLDGDPPVESLVVRCVNHRRTAAAELSLDPIASEHDDQHRVGGQCDQ